MPPFDINTATTTATTTGINITPESGINFYCNTGVTGEPAGRYDTTAGGWLLNQIYVSMDPSLTLNWIFLKETGNIVGIRGCVNGQDVYIYFISTTPAEDEIEYEPMSLSVLNAALKLYRAQIQEFISAEDRNNCGK